MAISSTLPLNDIFTISVNIQSPKSGLDLWTSQGDSEVSLRIGESGLAAETPVTVHQLFAAAVESYGQHTALSWKDGQLYKKLSYREYYQNCRTAAKSFLKVNKMKDTSLLLAAWTHCSCTFKRGKEGVKKIIEKTQNKNVFN